MRKQLLITLIAALPACGLEPTSDGEGPRPESPDGSDLLPGTHNEEGLVSLVDPDYSVRIQADGEHLFFSEHNDEYKNSRLSRLPFSGTPVSSEFLHSYELSDFRDYFRRFAVDGDRVVALSDHGDLWTLDRYGRNKQSLGFLDPSWGKLIGVRGNTAYVVDIEEIGTFTLFAVDLEYGDVWPLTNAVPGFAGRMKMSGDHMVVEGSTGLTILYTAGSSTYRELDLNYAQPCEAQDGHFFFVRRNELLAVHIESGNIAGTWSLPTSPAECVGVYGSEIVYTEDVGTDPFIHKRTLVAVSTVDGTRRLIIDPKPRGPIFAPVIREHAVYWWDGGSQILATSMWPEEQ